MADPVRDLSALLTHERGNRRQIVTGIVGHAVAPVVLIALGQAVTAHFRNPHVEAQPRQIRAEPEAFGGKPEAPIGKAAVQQNHRHAAWRRVIGHAQAGDGDLHGPVRAVAGFQSIDVFAQIAAPLGADQRDRKQVAAALHNALAQKRAASDGARPTSISRPAPTWGAGQLHTDQAWPSARKNQVSSTVSGFSDTLSMPCSISHLARSGWSEGP